MRSCSLFSCSCSSCLFPPTSALPRRTCLFHDVLCYWPTKQKSGCPAPLIGCASAQCIIRYIIYGKCNDLGIWQCICWGECIILEDHYSSCSGSTIQKSEWTHSIMKKLVGIVSCMEMPKQGRRELATGKTSSK